MGGMVPNSYSSPPKTVLEMSDDLIFTLCSSSEIRQMEAKESEFLQRSKTCGSASEPASTRVVQRPLLGSGCGQHSRQSPSLGDVWRLLSA